MPIKIPATLPARAILEREGVTVMTEETALRQDIRPLRIALLNLMPNKAKTETQFARLIGSTPLQIELTLIKMTEHVSKNTSAEHMELYYAPWAEARSEKFDGLIITGAPIELLRFEDVSYWEELTQVFAWTQSHVHSTLAICWGAQAMLHHFHGVAKHELPAKAFGCFRHKNRAPGNPILRGVSDDIVIPVSRWTEIRANELPAGRGLDVLLDAEATGPCLIQDPAHRAFYMFNHIEYDTESLGDEYRRDVDAGKTIAPPANYFPDDDPARPAENRWRSHAHVLIGNWINEIYQTTPYDTARIGSED